MFILVYRAPTCSAKSSCMLRNVTAVHAIVPFFLVNFDLIVSDINRNDMQTRSSLSVMSKEFTEFLRAQEFLLNQKGKVHFWV